MQTVLVTGATGFVGSHVLEALAGREWLKPIAACRDPGRLPAGFKGEVRPGDLRDPEYRRTLVEGVDTLCHAAAWTSIWGHRADSERLFLAPSLGLIEAARAAGVRRFVNTSTTSAAAPPASADPQRPGIPRAFWPHLCNVIAIEDALRRQASAQFQAINLRLGIFAGRRYGLGLLPVLVPRLKTRLVPWVAGGRTGLPIVDGRDIGQAFALAAGAEGLAPYESFDCVGPSIPLVREVIDLLHLEYGLPRPAFGVPFALAYPFAWLMETLDPLVPWEPLVTRSIVHLLEETGADQARAERLLGYRPVHPWQESVRAQLEEMRVREMRPMPLARPLPCDPGAGGGRPAGLP
jgi:nucleoside-diphosphate-sugar epimerase